MAGTIFRRDFWTRERLTSLSTAVFACGWFWFGVTFTAREDAWWNSLWVGIAIFAVATGLAARGERSRRGLGVLAICTIFLAIMITLELG